MKNTLFTLAIFFCLPFSAYSQISKGAWLLGGGINFGNSTFKDAKADTLQSESSNVYLTPRMGWFINNNWVIGLSPSYSHSYYKTLDPNPNNNYESQSTTFTIAPFIRYYKPLDEKWAIFAEFNGINLHFSSSKDKRPYVPTHAESTSQGYQLGVFIRPGVTYFISKKVGIEASLGSIGYGFSHYKGKNTNNTGSPEQETVVNTSSGGINLNNLIQNISLGIHIYLSGK